MTDDRDMNETEQAAVALVDAMAVSTPIELGAAWALAKQRGSDFAINAHERAVWRKMAKLINHSRK